jgi:hypothetical protein
MQDKLHDTTLLMDQISSRMACARGILSFPITITITITITMTNTNTIIFTNGPREGHYSIPAFFRRGHFVPSSSG